MGRAECLQLMGRSSLHMNFGVKISIVLSGGVEGKADFRSTRGPRRGHRHFLQDQPWGEALLAEHGSGLTSTSASHP